MSLKKFSNVTFLRFSEIILWLDHWQIQCPHLVKRPHCYNREYDANLFGFPLSSIVDLVPDSQLVWPARINSILSHRPLIDGEPHTVLLVHLSWYKFHPRMLKLGQPITVWCSTAFEVKGIHSIVPIQVIQSRTVTLVTFR